MWRPVITALALSACSAEPSNAPPAVTDEPVIAERVAGEWPDEFVWLRGQAAPGRAWLAFQPDESDNIQIAFVCMLASGNVSVEAFDPQQRGTELILRSGDVTRSFSAEPIRDETGDFFGDAIKARANVPINDAVIAAFSQSGALSSGEPAIAYRTATAEELALIQGFFDLCEA